MDLTEAEDIKKRWQEYTEELYKKDLKGPDNRNDVITHLEPDIVECEVKWALKSITKLVEVMELQLSYFKSKKMMLKKKKNRWCCESASLNMSANLESLSVATGLEKVSFNSNPKERHF